MSLYTQLTTMSKEDNEFFGEARWRALHLLGELRDPRAKDFLFKIVTTAMPVPDEVWWSKAITPKNSSNELGCFVTLDERA